jgi:hypothetical protein
MSGHNDSRNSPITQAPRLPSCAKIAYASRKAARAALKRMIASPAIEASKKALLGDYRCERCGGIHLGKSSRRAPIGATGGGDQA